MNWTSYAITLRTSKPQRVDHPGVVAARERPLRPLALVAQLVERRLVDVDQHEIVELRGSGAAIGSERRRSRARRGGGSGATAPAARPGPRPARPPATAALASQLRRAPRAQVQLARERVERRDEALLGVCRASVLAPGRRERGGAWERARGRRRRR